MNREMSALFDRKNKLVQVVKALDFANASFRMDSAQQKVVAEIQEQATNEIQICKEKLVPLQKAVKARKKLEKAAAQKKQDKAKAGLRAINKRIRAKQEKTHRISKFNQITARFVQGGSPGLGKKT